MAITSGWNLYEPVFHFFLFVLLITCSDFASALCKYMQANPPTPASLPSEDDVDQMPLLLYGEHADKNLYWFKSWRSGACLSAWHNLPSPFLT